MTRNEYLDAAVAAIRKHGLDPLRTGSRPGHDGLIADGAAHSFSTHPDRETDQAGWYAVHLYRDGIIVAFGDLRGWGDRHEVFSQFDENVTRERRAALQDQSRQRTVRAADVVRRERAARLASEIWAAASPARGDHPYLQRKGVGPNGLRCLSVEQIAAIIGYRPKTDEGVLQGDVIVVPMRVAGKLSTIEMVDGPGLKASLWGGTRKAAYWAPAELVGEREIGLAEGMATAKTVTLATSAPCVSVGSTGNFAAVLESFRALYPFARLVVYADKGNGSDIAAKAAERFGVEIVSPPEDLARTDFNDLQAERGIEAVRAWIQGARRPEDRIYFRDAAQPQQIDMVLPGFVAGSLGLMVGQGAIGKSFFSLEIAIGIALGRPVAGIPGFVSDAPGEALLLFGEDSKKIILNRMYSIRQAERFTDDEIETLDRRVDIRSKLGQSIRITQFDYKTAQPGPFLPELHRLCVGRRIAIVDPLALMHDADERDNGQMTQVMAALYGIAYSTNCSILVIHHVGKGNGEREMWAAARGASAVTNSSRWQLNLAPPCKEQMEEWGIAESKRDQYVSGQLTKHNYGKRFPDFLLRRNDDGVIRYLDPREARSAPRAADTRGGLEPESAGGYFDPGDDFGQGGYRRRAR